ncbi:MAG TPA: hypothetical protein ENN27_04755 [Candidatus Atribacteria bacterium]|nr:hypothetical protein [Candidatus Atribacteria bacterium]
MKTISLIQKLAAWQTRFIFVTAISFFSISCTSQSEWDSSEVKGRTSVFKCNKVGENLHITNSNYVDPMKTRTEYNWDELDFSYISLSSHDSFLEAFKEAFTESRIKKLAAVNDFVSMIIGADEKGQILGIYFILDKGTTILPEELEVLERELLSRIKFVVIGKKVEDLFFYRVHLRVYFSEVQDGEIRMVRHSVNLKNRY